MYGNEQVHPTHALIVKCENGYGVDLCMTLEGEQNQRTFVAMNLEEAIEYVRKFFSEGAGNEE